MSSATHDKLIELSFAQFQELYTTNDLYLLDFHADWCGPCHALSPILVGLQTSFPNIKFRAVNVDLEQEFAANFEVRSIPAVFIVQFTGVSFEVLEEFKGAKDGIFVHQIIEKALAKAKSSAETVNLENNSESLDKLPKTTGTSI